jgi:DNA-3-methyladenine glycosylase I
MFWNFDIAKILESTDEALLERMVWYNIIKNKLKVLGVKKNALAYQKIVAEHGSLDTYIWSFVDHAPIVNHRTTYRECPSSTPLSEAMSKSLKQYGFTFVWPTICYAYMQAAGLVDDHEVGCMCRKMG